MNANTYTVTVGSHDAYYPIYVDSDTLAICERYAEAWAKRGANHWAEVVSDDTREVVQFHGTRHTRDGYCFTCGVRPQLGRVLKCRECTARDAAA